ncbi:hypothetical protein [Polaribacter sp. IC073]|uniref:hypothetical protein n=1 Tax=Polaribacter sp. IC073 TaxID=2508540 RepID=UPI0011BE0219|nr:hypothetical protein [Polaribacter sp. IC073]TXD49998.1 hypothetical protein ES045_02115 [Polaribacter sp. IC073]
MRKILIIISVFIFYNCSEKRENKVENTYKIIHLLYNDITTDHIKTLSFPPPQPPLNNDANWDSIYETLELNRKIKKDTVKKLKSFIQENGKLIVALNPTLFVSFLEDFKKEYIEEYLEDYEVVFDSLKKIKNTLEINVSEIPNNKYSYILPYQKYYSRMPRKGYDKYDMILNFSRIAFNENNTKAIIIMGVGFGKLNGFSAMYFLENRKGKWFIKHEKGLTIS